MRSEGVLEWYSMDTGPSVFTNTTKDQVKEVTNRISKLKVSEIIVSGIGDKVALCNQHLF